VKNKMKLAVIKFGGRINGNGDGAIGGEVLIAVDLLVKGGNEVHCYTKLCNKDILIKDVIFHDSSTFDPNTQYDALIVINGNINFYGGLTSTVEMDNLKIINSFKGKVIYMLFDPMLPLKQYWDGIKIKQDKYNWSDKYTEKEMFIERDDIIYISQPYNLQAVDTILQKTGVKHKYIVHYPLYKMHLAYYDRLTFNNNPRLVDLSYGGTFRNKKREDKLIKFYFGYPDNYNIDIFGKIKLDNFTSKKIINLTSPKFTSGVPHNCVRYRMEKSLGTVVIGDKWYEGKNLAQRVYENILSNTINFIDLDLDPMRLVYSHDTFFDMLYVKDREEVIRVLDMIKEHPDRLKDICDAQYDCVSINKQQYIDDLTDMIGNLT